MRRFIWLLLVLIISVWLGLQVAKDPGLAFFSYRQWSVEMPLWVALLGLIIAQFLFYLVGCLLRGIESSFYRWGNWWRWHRKNQSYSKTNRGLIELIEGHWEKAENYLTAGLSQSDAPLINYLALAKAAHEQGAYDRRDSYLCKAHAVAAQAEVAIGLTQAQFQINQGQLEQALATLNHLRMIAPKQGLVLKLIERIYVHLADWQNVLKLLPSLYKAKVVTSEQRALLEQNTYAELLKSAANHSSGLVSLRDIWGKMPRQLQKDPHLLGCYAQQLSLYPGQVEEVAELLSKSLKKSWDANLVVLYGVLDTADPIKQLAQAEDWLSRYPNQALLFLTLGRLSMRCQLWGKAGSYFEESLKLEENAVTYLEYGKLLEQLKNPVSALQIYRKGLVKVSTFLSLGGSISKQVTDHF